MKLVNFRVNKFYEDDKYSRIMPGPKDHLSVGKKQHLQKRLHADIKTGFSKCCHLRRKWCVLLGASGTHCVCVCTYHQNMKFILDPLNLEYKDLLKFLVCGP